MQHKMLDEQLACNYIRREHSLAANALQCIIHRTWRKIEHSKGQESNWMPGMVAART